MATVYITTYSRGVSAFFLPTTIHISQVPEVDDDDDDEARGGVYLRIDTEYGKIEAIRADMLDGADRILDNLVSTMPNQEPMKDLIVSIIAQYSNIPSTRVDFLIDVIEMNLTIHINSIDAMPLIRIAPAYIKKQVTKICDAVCAVHRCATARISSAAAQDTLEKMEAAQRRAFECLASSFAAK